MAHLINDEKSGQSTANSSTPLLRSERQNTNIQSASYLALPSTPNELSSSTRRPFHFPPDQQNVGQLYYGNRDLPEASVTYNRYRYYSRLSGAHSGSNSQRLQIPDHVIPFYFYIPRIGIHIETDSMGNAVIKQNSFVTIFAIWNMLMGTSLLCLPWALHKAGLLTGLILLLLMVGICCYTANLIISIPKMANLKVIEFSDVCYHLLGRSAHIISLFSSLITLIGGCIVYWVLMTNFLDHIITFVYQIVDQNVSISTNMTEVTCVDDDNYYVINNQSISNNSIIVEPNDTFYDDLNKIVPFLLAVLMGPVVSLKSVNFFMKFNIVGSLSVVYLLLFAVYKSLEWGPINVDFTNENSLHFTKLFDWNFPAFTGVLSLSLFIHNVIISLLRNNQKQENNIRDLIIAYILVGLTYLLIASLIYVSFPISKDCLKDNFLNNFESNDILAFITRAFLLLQVFSLFPLLVLMLRIQIMHLLMPNTSPGYLHIICLNAILISLCVAFALYFPKIGTIIRYVGAFSGLVYIFSLPPLAHLKAKQITGQHIPLIEYVFHYSIITIGLFNFLAQFYVQ